MRPAGAERWRKKLKCYAQALLRRQHYNKEHDLMVMIGVCIYTYVHVFNLNTRLVFIISL